MGALPPVMYLIITLAAFIIAGGLLIWVAGYIKRGGKGGSKGHQRPPTASAPAEPGSPAPTGEQELLRVSRTTKGGLAVFVQGQRYRHLQEVKDTQVGRETIEALKAVLAFAEGWLPTLTPSQPAPTESTVDEEAFLDRLRRSDLFSPSPRRRGAGGGVKPRPEPLIPLEKINDLVQERLRERPDLAGQHVRLTTGPGESLRIYVGQQTFDAVGHIPDPQIRALIQDAIREWENG
jgi:hypothetical protein